MLNIIKFAARLALQTPKVRDGIKKVAIKDRLDETEINFSYYSVKALA